MHVSTACAILAPVKSQKNYSERVRVSEPETFRGMKRGYRPSRATVITVGVAIIVLGSFAAVMLASRGQQPGGPPEGVQSFEITNRDHTRVAVSYPQTPPVGGEHSPIWQNCGFYDQPVRNENAVHSMEHGAVWITYRPDLPQDQVSKLRKLADGQTFVLVSPYPNLPAPVVASAWGKQLRLDSADDPRLKQFIRAFRSGPQTPEPGAPCTGGTGQPK